MLTRIILSLFAGITLITAASAQDVIRHRTPGSNFPIAAAVEVPAGKTLVFVSGMVPRVTNEQAPRNTIASFGDTKQQTVSVLQTIDQALQRMNLAMKDVVKMQVFLVADPAKDNRMDFAGFMEGYTQFFGTPEQPNLPARSVMAVAGLVNPGWLVEIEVTAVRP
jgi:enamine deaminase RidA (YjgF/YER057c/UK114 family)